MSTWKKINGYTNYSVSDEGQVRNDTTMRVLSPALDSNGYQFVILCKNGERWHGYIHQLVANAFIPNFRNLCEVNHKDENKRNNHKGNLEWCTHSENVKHSLAKRRAVTAKKPFCASKRVWCILQSKRHRKPSGAVLRLCGSA